MSGEMRRLMKQAMMEHVGLILKQHQEQVEEGSAECFQFFLPMDFHLTLDRHQEAFELLLAHPEGGQEVEEAVLELLEEELGEGLAARTSGQLRVVLEWDTIPYAERTRAALKGQEAGMRVPMRLCGVVTQIGRPETLSYSSTHCCVAACGDNEPLVLRTEATPAEQQARCPRCLGEVAELESSRGAHLAQRILLMPPGAPTRPHEEVLLVGPESGFLHPNDLGAMVRAIGRMHCEVTGGGGGGGGDKLRVGRVKRLLKASSVTVVPRQQSNAPVLEASGSARKRLEKALGLDGPFLMERLGVHLILLSSMVDSTIFTQQQQQQQQNNKQQQYQQQQQQQQLHHRHQHYRQQDFVPGGKLSGLFFGAVCESFLHTGAALVEAGLGAVPIVVASPSAGSILPRFRVDRERGDWLHVQAGLAHLARDELLLIPHVFSLAPAEQLQLANINDRAKMSTTSLLVPELDCPVAVLAWCTVPEDASYARYQRGEITLSRLLGCKLQPLLLQSMDLVWQVADARDVDDILAKTQASLVSPESILYLRSAARSGHPLMGPEARELLATFYELHRRLSGVSRRELTRAIALAEMCARLLGSSEIQRYHGMLAACLCENTFKWKGIPLAVSEGIPTRSIDDFDRYAGSLEEVIKRFKASEWD